MSRPATAANQPRPTPRVSNTTALALALSWAIAWLLAGIVVASRQPPEATATSVIALLGGTFIGGHLANFLYFGLTHSTLERTAEPAGAGRTFYRAAVIGGLCSLGSLTVVLTCLWVALPPAVDAATILGGLGAVTALPPALNGPLYIYHRLTARNPPAVSIRYLYGLSSPRPTGDEGSQLPGRRGPRP